MARRFGFANYFALNVGNHDHQGNPTHGSCRDPRTDGGLGGYGGTAPCKASSYFEPASGFWIVDPATKLIGNSIGGCQGFGHAYWYVPPTNAGDSGKPGLADLKFMSIGEFRNNRAHSCYSGLYAEPEDTVVSEQLLPHCRQARRRFGVQRDRRADGHADARPRHMAASELLGRQERAPRDQPRFRVARHRRRRRRRHAGQLGSARGLGVGWNQSQQCRSVWPMSVPWKNRACRAPQQLQSGPGNLILPLLDNGRFTRSRS